MPQMPETLKPKPFEAALPVPVTYKVMGMGPAQFGFLTFLMCAFVSLSVLFLTKGPLTRAWPPFGRLYHSMGITVRAPGEGLRIEALSAENQIDKESHTLFVNGTVSNISDRKIAWPTLRVTLKSAYGAALHSWDIPATDKPGLASGQSVPVKSEFNDAPEGGESVDVRVVEP
jgi:hypothetical protein